MEAGVVAALSMDPGTLVHQRASPFPGCEIPQYFKHTLMFRSYFRPYLTSNISHSYSSDNRSERGNLHGNVIKLLVLCLFTLSNILLYFLISSKTFLTSSQCFFQVLLLTTDLYEANIQHI